jgi:DnaD/phage-associated family protein
MITCRCNTIGLQKGRIKMKNNCIKITGQFKSTPIPNFIIDKYMSLVNPVFILIYIFLYKKNYFNDKEKISLSDIAKKFNILEADVMNALNYFYKKDLLCYNIKDNYLEIEFYLPTCNAASQTEKNIKSKFEDNQTEKNIKSKFEQENFFDETKFCAVDNKAEKKFANNDSLLSGNKYSERNCFLEFPTYGLEEINLYKNNSCVQDLFESSQNILGRYLSYCDLNNLFAFYDYLRLPIDVIKLLLEYCVSNNNKNFSYIKKVAVDWATCGINSEEKVRVRILESNKFYNKIKKILVINNLNMSQKKVIDSWQKNMPEELILEACDLAMLNIGKPNFKYINSILNEWRANNIKTLDQVKKYNNQKLSNLQKKCTNRFANFEQRKWDFNAIKHSAQQD